MEVIKKHFEEEAKEFDKIILRLIPYYSEMIDGMVSAIPLQRSSAINVIDLGCGTGTISKRIKESFPRANKSIKLTRNSLANFGANLS